MSLLKKIDHLTTKMRTFGKRISNWLCKEFSFFNERSYLRIMVYGDSNSFRPDGGEKSWPGIFQNKNRSLLRVFNESRDGRTIGYDTGQYNGLTDIQCKLDTYNILDYIIIMLGTNDLKVEYGSPTPVEIAKNMGNLIDVLALYGGDIKPILLTPPPMGMVTSGQLAGAHSKVKQLASEFRKLAFNRSIPLIDIYSVLNVFTDFENDMIHINATGRQKIANAVWSEILVQSTSRWKVGNENMQRPRGMDMDSYTGTLLTYPHVYKASS